MVTRTSKPKHALPHKEALSLLKSTPKPAHKSLLAMRDIIFRVGDDDLIGGVEETLKWGQPSYLARNKRVGSTIRLGFDEKQDRCMLYCHCQSTLVDQWRTRYAEYFEFSGNRGLMLPANHQLPKEEFADCVWLALTYHTRAKK